MIRTLLRILIVEDSEDDAVLILHQIKKGGYSIEYERVSTFEKMKAALKDKTWDIILSDFKMPRFNGLKALELLKESGLDIPFIIISGTIGEEVAVEVMKAGANDYLMKNNLKRLIPAIERELRESESRAERVRVEQERKQTEKKLVIFSLALEQSPASILITDIEGKIEYVNSKFTRVTGYTQEEALGKTPRILKSGEMSQEYYKQLWGTITSGMEWNGEFHNKKKNGEMFWELASISPIKDKSGVITHFLAVKEDITDRKQTERELLIAKEKAEESSRLKNEFLHNMSHEIRTPMNGIVGFAQLLNDADLSAENQKKFTKIINSSSEQLLRIIDDILEISQLETKQVIANEEKVCLNELLFELFSIFEIKAKEKGIPLYLKKALPDNLSFIYTDKVKINKIVSNLVENALKFTQTGYIDMGYQLLDNKIEIFIEDTGIGISPEYHEVVFERFSQEVNSLAKVYGGLGLGLSIAKENTELLGGQITLKSEKGKGSTFFVKIPYKPVFSDGEQNGSDKNIKINHQIEYHTVLIAEDDETNYLYLETLLERFNPNLKIIHARNGQEAVEICHNRKEINLVLMDIKMPLMNGNAATKEIKSFRPELPVIAQTAYSTNDDNNLSKSAGCDDFISKPIGAKGLYSMISRYLIK
jgi:PAS domain S-box-containing protein